ncbi:hypothetical protein M2451_002605 [Dysgonomonas sp. PFB1-18]|nr:hypothetical protein [Dysgonomonas sp. PF1-14]MDH6339625.1 hypothetical protein [Dysgonomonas sp. PF1-16]MDH6381276.1 hypothetical protein [Dysgonomonas sp. PFB1-18]MDH6398488.1 hypothetical protein [Dysgonomonas sp. PF1-23]
MRFALRNKSKLIKAFGEPFYLQLIKCLSNHFESNVQIDRLEIEGLNYQVIEVPKSSSEIYQFAVTREMYDVLTLAYYKTVER